ncbi:gliding motility lipoprotein GldD [Flavobacterium sp.]|jgi:gliding motility-associated lipoprotein GldD|uniref:gliding motility lipoprotein GldD n=1 Tax=Flavobacterium sp. TaxID=239 RepID=UPI002FDA920D
MYKYLVLVGVVFSVFGCKNEIMPKPAAHLRLDYPVAQYFGFDSPCPFVFDFNSNTKVKVTDSCYVTIEYPKMKATVYLTYKPVTATNLEELLKDAQKLTYKHVVKADDISEIPFLNRNHKVYGMFYQVGGNAATNTQFYATDSTKHFLSGSVYFYAKPNFDSIMPAASYIKDDMKTLMETLRWKN